MRYIFPAIAIITALSMADVAIEQDLFSIPNQTTFYLDFSDGFNARTQTGVITAANLGNPLPKIQQQNGINYIRPVDSQALAFDALEIFPARKGTIEMLVRAQLPEGDDIGKQHLFSLYQSETERMYLRFDGMEKLHYFLCSSSPVYNSHTKLPQSITERNLWTLLSFQWDFTRTSDAQICLYLNGKRIWYGKELKFPAIELNAQALLYIGSWINGTLSATNFDIATVEVSRGWKYETENVSKVENILDIQIFEFAVDYLNNIVATYTDTLNDEEKSAAANWLEDIRKIRNDYIADEELRVRNIELCDAIINDNIKPLENINKARRWQVFNHEEHFMSAIVNGAKIGVFVEDTSRKITTQKPDYEPSSMQSVPLLYAASNEYEPFQLVVASFADHHGVELAFEASELRSGQNIIESDNIEIYKVVSLGNSHPDPLLPVKSFSLNSSELLVLWVNVYVPPSTAAGEYEGSIIISGKDNKLTVPFTLNVWNFELPVRSSLKTAVGLSPEYIRAWTPDAANKDINQLTDEYVKYMLRQRTSPKAYARFELEMSEQSKADALAYGGDPEQKKEALLESNRDFFHPRQILKKDGSIELDFTEFDKIIEKYMPLGLNSFIAGNRYWDAQNSSREVLRTGGNVKELRHRLWVYDEEKGYERTLYLPVLSDYYKQTMISIFSQWQSHLKDKGILDMAYGYILDEPTPQMFEFLSELYRIAKIGAPEIPLMTTNKPIKEIQNVDIWCPMFHHCGVELIERSLDEGKNMWYYVCMEPVKPYANLFLYQSPIEHRIFFWQIHKYGGKGFLYWEANFWYHENPNSGMMGMPYSRSMDGSLLYAGKNGPIGSLRYEYIREGIEDYDYFALLAKALEENKLSDEYAAIAREILDIPKQIVNSPSDYTHDYGMLMKYRKQVGDMIEMSNN